GSPELCSRWRSLSIAIRTYPEPPSSPHREAGIAQTVVSFSYHSSCVRTFVWTKRRESFLFNLFFPVGGTAPGCYGFRPDGNFVNPQARGGSRWRLHACSARTIAYVEKVISKVISGFWMTGNQDSSDDSEHSFAAFVHVALNISPLAFYSSSRPIRAR